MTYLFTACPSCRDPGPHAAWTDPDTYQWMCDCRDCGEIFPAVDL